MSRVAEERDRDAFFVRISRRYKYRFRISSACSLSDLWSMRLVQVCVIWDSIAAIRVVLRSVGGQDSATAIFILMLACAYIVARCTAFLA